MTHLGIGGFRRHQGVQVQRLWRRPLVPQILHRRPAIQGRLLVFASQGRLRKLGNLQSVEVGSVFRSSLCSAALDESLHTSGSEAPGHRAGGKAAKMSVVPEAVFLILTLLATDHSLRL